MSKKPVVLMILDGYGLNDNCDHNAVCEGRTPVMDQLMSQCPFVKGNASGLAVGLPDGQMGNSEVGHLNMGAGRIVYQELTRITKSIQDGDFFDVPEFLQAVENCKKNHSALHLWGLVSDGGVHSHNTHIYGLLELAKRNGLDKVYVHCFLDGRDTPPASGKGFVEELEAKMKEIGVGKVASVMGRYYAMDRDNRWDRVERAYNALTKGEGKTAVSAADGIQASYDAEVNDEFVEPFVVVEDGKPVAVVNDHDSVIFFNFRPDRAREITRAFCDDEFKGFAREKRLDLTYVCFTDYDDTIANKLVAFKKEAIVNTFGQYLADHNMTQARIAETEKYAHVTFFFNGGVEEPNKGEDRILVPSPKVATYDLQPEMSAPAVCDKLVEAIKSGKYDVIIINFANPDMVGHTGIEDAAIKAIETVDACVGRTVDAVKETDGILFICADHGNAEQLVDYETGTPFTAHTTNPVPFILVNADPSFKLREGGCLADIAPTLIELMGMEQPKEMTGKSLLVK
ncbi:MAG: 2,3-bisphosphoglycerate-independent phosphoglycerate mutase [Hungatella hathewayi]|uniref:2,3-bisphosphoglycerate-independent phosphoglycerate mutase n=1 Tax=Hungatella TaxID=1649459 RepID=UPI001106F77F|nr:MULTISPECIES: 2,3-bisphosphoglycerate-independent phosphoglycerate mutase [Hungatella]MCI6455138.1 2,3-bisphosphoglycerate-independent phosphoglycerate mutase [Hungatella sp.]MCI7379963.1 2,3-bisphosphoglycerate-independent phosphoglycerate mutase [Hungatella sp.]MDY6240114.1 2,3-bisphosphoglycerate-independent phosphoglycerate mutase [Hungatella hathewayi]